MPQYTWLATFIIGFVLIPLILRIIWGKRPPPTIFGTSYIRQQLQKRKIADSDVPDECISELVDIAISSAEIEKAAGNSFKKSFAMLLDSMTDVILLWRSNPQDTMFQPIGGETNIFRDIMERNRVPYVQDTVAGTANEGIQA